MREYDTYPMYEKILKRYRKQYPEEPEFDFLPGDVYGAMDMDYHSLNRENPQRWIKNKLRPGMQLYPAHSNQKEILLLPGTGKKRGENEALKVTPEESSFLLKTTYFLYHLDMYILKRKIRKYFGTVPSYLVAKGQEKFEELKESQGML